ncbi:hypothetical protein I79_017681 [Cricetulus griseus]|uniref:Uncharacterized protein n=1 Tax=Cricetulus griseus TaxID=10029 RepID=G3I2N8_CRIGR|nr:hypothetical protein I79_017681 [Cricetulus griseus]
MPLGRTYTGREGAEEGYQLNWELVSPAQHPVICSGVPCPAPPALHENLAKHYHKSTSFWEDNRVPSTDIHSTCRDPVLYWL